LMPSLAVPKIESVLIDASVCELHDDKYGIDIEQVFFLKQPSNQTSTVPIHRCSVRVEYADVSVDVPCRSLSFVDDKSATVDSSLDTVVCTGSGYFRLKYSNFFPLTVCAAREFESRALPLKVVTTFETATDGHLISVTAEALPKEGQRGSYYWS